MNSKLVVIGSGSSGIAAATKAIELGFSNVLVLEAENRIGGRISTISFASNVIDLGAQWCHGEKDNVVFEHASKNLKNYLCASNGYSTFNCIRSNKEIVPQDISNRLHKLILGLLNENSHHLHSYEGSLGEYLFKNFFKSLESPDNADINSSLAKEYFEFYEKYENSIEASDSLFDVSAKGYMRYRECEGHPLLNWKDKGYITFLQSLMKSTDKKKYGTLEGRILFNKRVVEIKWSTNSEKTIFITCSDGHQIEADHVICTVSLGVLKENYLTLFKPNLPISKVNAIEGLGFGTVNKIFIEFPKRFWYENWPGFSMLWDQDELGEMHKRQDSWIVGVFGFCTVDFQENILCGWVTGKNARAMEIASDDEVLESCMFLLNKFLKWDIPTPINIKRSSWYNNINFRGSYSFRSIKTEEFNTNARDLSTPILNEYNKPILQFAGEATHDHYYSTVHGATESGWREATRLADFYLKKQSHI